MRLITEDVVKKIIKAGKYVVDGKLLMPADCMLTPSAKAAVIDHKLKLVQDDGTRAPKRADSTGSPPPGRGSSAGFLSAWQGGSPDIPPAGTAEATAGGAPARKRRYTLPDGTTAAKKPEHLTQLSGTLLVTKGDLRIHLRGEVDLLIAELLKAQLRIAELGFSQLVDDLQDVYDFIRKLSRAEILDEPFTAETIIGLSYSDIRDISHHPQRHFGRGHIFDITYQDGEVTLLLNALRAQARHCELVFYEAFKTEDGSASRGDLMEGYNRLSSILYILCLRAVTNRYGEQ